MNIVGRGVASSPCFVLVHMSCCMISITRTLTRFVSCKILKVGKPFTETLQTAASTIFLSFYSFVRAAEEPWQRPGNSNTRRHVEQIIYHAVVFCAKCISQRILDLLYQYRHEFYSSSTTHILPDMTSADLV